MVMSRMGSQPTSWLLGRRLVCLSVSFYGSLSTHFQPLTPSQPHTSSGESIYGVCFVDTSIGNFHVCTSRSPLLPYCPPSPPCVCSLVASPFLALLLFFLFPALLSPFLLSPLHAYLGTHPKCPAFFLSLSSLPPSSLICILILPLTSPLHPFLLTPFPTPTYLVCSCLTSLASSLTTASALG